MKVLFTSIGVGLLMTGCVAFPVDDNYSTYSGGSYPYYSDGYEYSDNRRYQSPQTRPSRYEDDRRYPYRPATHRPQYHQYDNQRPSSHRPNTNHTKPTQTVRPQPPYVRPKPTENAKPTTPAKKQIYSSTPSQTTVGIKTAKNQYGPMKVVLKPKQNSSNKNNANKEKRKEYEKAKKDER